MTFCTEEWGKCVGQHMFMEQYDSERPEPEEACYVTTFFSDTLIPIIVNVSGIEICLYVVMIGYMINYHT